MSKYIWGGISKRGLTQLVVFKEIMARYLTNSSCQLSNQISRWPTPLAKHWLKMHKSLSFQLHGFFFFFFLTSIWAFDVKIIHDFWKVYLYVSNQLWRGRNHISAAQKLIGSNNSISKALPNRFLIFCRWITNTKAQKQVR